MTSKCHKTEFLGFMVDDVICLKQIDGRMVYCTIMLVAHYLFDWFIQGWWIKDTSLNAALKRFHHLISALAIICALIVGSGYVTIV
jgi:hypothetical protein